MRKSNNFIKYAFTLPEIMIALSIMGVLIIVSLHTINEHFTDFSTRYYTAYDSLAKAVYNTYTDTYCRIKVNEVTDCTTNNSISKGRPFPTTKKDLCKRLAEYLNLAEGSSCDSKTEKASIINANDSEFNNKSLQFALSNGFKFYFSDKREQGVTYGRNNSKSKTIEYFIVYIDLNGDSKPNSFGLPHPDIVPFIVTRTGDTIPVGYPIYDKRYVSARILNYKGEQTISYTIDEARILAFGTTPYIDIPLTLIPQLGTLPRNIRPNTIPNTQIEIDAGNGCEEGTYNCTVKIDENLEKRY